MPGQVAYLRTEKGRHPEVAARGCLPIQVSWRLISQPTPLGATRPSRSSQPLPALTDCVATLSTDSPDGLAFMALQGVNLSWLCHKDAVGAGQPPALSGLWCPAKQGVFTRQQALPWEGLQSHAWCQHVAQPSALHLTITGSSLGLGLAFKAQGLPCSHASLISLHPSSPHILSPLPLCHWARLLLTSHLCSSCSLCQECTPSSCFHHLTNSYALFKSHSGSEMPFLTPLPAPHCVEGAG